MLIETTTSFDTQEDAEDSLAGIKELPGFCLGYVRLPSSPRQKFDVVHVFECTITNPTLKLNQQRELRDFRSNPNSLKPARAASRSSQPTIAWNHEKAGLG